MYSHLFCFDLRRQENNGKLRLEQKLEMENKIESLGNAKCSYWKKKPNRVNVYHQSQIFLSIWISRCETFIEVKFSNNCTEALFCTKRWWFGELLHWSTFGWEGRWPFNHFESLIQFEVAPSQNCPSLQNTEGVGSPLVGPPSLKLKSNISSLGGGSCSRSNHF